MPKKLRNAIWYSPAMPDARQADEIEKMGYRLFVGSDGRYKGRSLAFFEIPFDKRSPEDKTSTLDCVIENLSSLVREADAVAIFGSFPVPLIHQSTLDAITEPGHWREATALYSSWFGYDYTGKGGPPCPVHKKWVLVGHLIL